METTLQNSNGQDFQESIHTLRCAAKAKRIHAPPNQDPATKKQIFMKMDEEIRVLQYLISDLTKKPTPSKVAEPLRAAKETTDVAEEFRPTGETDCRRSLQEKKVQVSSMQVQKLQCFSLISSSSLHTS